MRPSLTRVALALLSACTGAPARHSSPEGHAGPRAVRRLDGSAIGTDAIDRTVLRLMAAARVPGLALAIINDGKVAYLEGYGYRDVEKRAPMTPDTVMVGASFTKPAFAYAVMQAVDEGLMDLDRPVVKYFDAPLAQDEDYRDLAGDARLGRITPRMLLSHTSGFPNWRRFNDDGKLDIKAEPGSRYMYSGEGILLLQRAFFQATAKRSTVDEMRERVFAPLGMTRTSMVWQPELAADAAVGYDRDGKPLGHDHREHPDAAGSMDTTVRDWAAFLCAVLRGDRISKAARAEMLRPQIRIRSAHQFPTTDTETTDENDAIRLSYGLGWGLLSTPHGPAYFKEGHDDGFQHYSITFEEPRIAIAIMTNSDNGESIFVELLATLIGDRFTPWRWERYVPHDQRADQSAQSARSTP
jgi:CubicO group peptidase (beta-lactamase class C family)